MSALEWSDPEIMDLSGLLHAYRREPVEVVRHGSNETAVWSATIGHKTPATIVASEDGLTLTLCDTPVDLTVNDAITVGFELLCVQRSARIPFSHSGPLMARQPRLSLLFREIAARWSLRRLLHASHWSRPSFGAVEIESNGIRTHRGPIFDETVTLEIGPACCTCDECAESQDDDFEPETVEFVMNLWEVQALIPELLSAVNWMGDHFPVSELV